MIMTTSDHPDLVPTGQRADLARAVSVLSPFGDERLDDLQPVDSIEVGVHQGIEMSTGLDA
jgi:hypothetical protein